MSDSELLKQLLPIEEARLLPQSQFYAIALEVKKYAEYCDLIFVPDKFRNWCEYLGCNGGTCSYFSGTTTTGIPQTTSAYPKGCFDIWFCPPEWSASTTYMTQSVICLLLIAAFLLTAFYLPSFICCYSRPICPTTRLLLSSMVILDLTNIIVCFIIFCIAQLNRSYVDQLTIYSTYISRTIPYLFPLHELCTVMSLWLLTGLLFQQYLYQTQGNHTSVMLTWTGVIKIAALVTIFMIIFMILKILSMTTYHRLYDDTYRVVYSQLGQGYSYYHLITNWLKVPFEYFGPILLLSTLLICIYTTLGEQGLTKSLKNELSSDFLVTNDDNSTSRSQTKKDYRSYKLLIKDMIVFNRHTQQERIMIGVIFLSTVAVLFRIPHFVHHILVNEEARISPDVMFLLRFSSDDLQCILLFIKSIVYISFSLGYCGDFKRFLLATKHNGSCFCCLCCNNNNNNINNDIEITNENLDNLSTTNQMTRIDSLIPTSTIGRTFEQTIANQMRQSISYRQSVFATTKSDNNDDSDNVNDDTNV